MPFDQKSNSWGDFVWVGGVSWFPTNSQKYQNAEGSKKCIGCFHQLGFSKTWKITVKEICMITKHCSINCCWDEMPFDQKSNSWGYFVWVGGASWLPTNSQKYQKAEGTKKCWGCFYQESPSQSKQKVSFEKLQKLI